jgi:hypothetical protein
MMGITASQGVDIVVLGRLTPEGFRQVPGIFAPNALKVQDCWSLPMQQRVSSKAMQAIWHDAL